MAHHEALSETRFRGTPQTTERPNAGGNPWDTARGGLSYWCLWGGGVCIKLSCKWGVEHVKCMQG